MLCCSVLLLFSFSFSFFLIFFSFLLFCLGSSFQTTRPRPDAHAQHRLLQGEWPAIHLIPVRIRLITVIYFSTAGVKTVRPTTKVFTCEMRNKTKPKKQNEIKMKGNSKTGIEMEILVFEKKNKKRASKRSTPFLYAWRDPRRDQRRPKR